MPEAPTVPSAWQLEQSVSLWQQLQQLLESQPDLDEQQLWSAATGDRLPHPDEMLSRTIDATRMLDFQEEAIERAKVELDKATTQLEKRRGWYRSTIFALLQVMQKRKHAGTIARAHIQASRGSVVLLDQGLIPERFRKVVTTETIPLTPIREAIEAGEQVPGAVISNAADILVVRGV